MWRERCKGEKKRKWKEKWRGREKERYKGDKKVERGIGRWRERESYSKTKARRERLKTAKKAHEQTKVEKIRVERRAKDRAEWRKVKYCD